MTDAERIKKLENNIAFLEGACRGWDKEHAHLDEQNEVFRDALRHNEKQFNALCESVESILSNLPSRELHALALSGKLTEDAAERVAFALKEDDPDV